MECMIGMRFDDFAIVAVDSGMTMGGLVIAKDDEDKLYSLTSRTVMAMTGEAGDTSQFAEYCAKNVHLYKIRNGYEMSPMAAAHFTRANLVKALRSRSPYQVNMLTAGYDPEKGGLLFHCDYLGASVPVRHACFGYGGLVSLSVLDRYHEPGLDRQAAYDLIERCVREVRKTLIINTPNFHVAVVDKDGITRMPPIAVK